MKKLYSLGFFLLTTLISYAQKPNLVIIHTDEHNFRTLSCYRDNLPENEAYVWGKGLGVKTTNIDKIAKQGAICMNYYVTSPVCAPSRGSLISGLYRQHHGVTKNELPIKKNTKTIAHILSENGYATSYVGKWHLGDERKKYKFTETYKGGFLDNEFMMNKGHNPYFMMKNGKVIGAMNDKKYESAADKSNIVHATDFFVDKTIEIINRDHQQPFFVMVSIPDPHTPDYAKPPYNSLYNHLDLQAPETMSATSIKNRPEWANNKKNDVSHEGFKPQKLKQYFGMVKHIDDRIGDILKTLDKLQISDNTILIFTSDHGDMFYEHGRMNKSVPYDAAMKVPFVIRYPKKIKAQKIIETVQNNVDFVPTMLGIMNIQTSVAFDGDNNASDFLSKEAHVNRPNYIHVSSASNSWVALVNKKYKLILHKQYTPTLFDLDKDPHETTNVFNTKGYQKISEKLKDILIKRMKKHNEIAYHKGLQY
ncbi:sulfatase-like hydrolase/transferase [Ochrovirga pacifica]|uniref:sulfatase-like hydrolase/transferase n=1 Tax=Ochrovirga pacifica TaxID=1042376 RepID=UPI0002FAEB9E|nr:sulfatase-like hydrolase/transferase [Ochrovirga pacifica]